MHFRSSGVTSLLHWEINKGFHLLVPVIAQANPLPKPIKAQCGCASFSFYQQECAIRASPNQTHATGHALIHQNVQTTALAKSGQYAGIRAF